MADKAQLAVEIALENREYLRKLVASEKATKKLGGSISTLDKIAKSVIVIKLAQSIYAAGKAAVKSASEMQKYEIAFSTMLGSADKAKNLLDDIKKFSAETPFQLPGLVEASKKLLAFGIGQDEVIEKLRNLGNAASGDAESLKTLADAYGKIRVSGVASLEDINRFADRGTPIFEELAKVMGVSTGEMRKLISTGKVGFKEVDQALTNMTTGSGKFAGMLEKQSKSLGGILSTLGDQFGMILIGIGNELSPEILKLAKSLSRAASDGGIFSKALSGIVFIAKKAISLISNLINTIDMLASSEVGAKRESGELRIIGETNAIKANIRYREKRLETLEKEGADIGKQIELRVQIANLQEELRGKEDGLGKARAKSAQILGILNKEGQKQNDILKDNIKQMGIKPVAPPGGAKQDPLRDQIELMRYLGETDIANKLEVNRQKIELEKKYGEDMAEITQAAQDKIDEINRKSVENRIQQGLQLFSAASNIVGQIIALNQMATQNEISNLDRRHQAQRDQIENTIENEEERNAALAALDEQFEAEKRKIQREAAKKQKELQIYETALSIPTAAFQAYKALAGIPIVGPGLGIAAAAAATILGFKKLQLIKSQPLPALATGAIDVPSDMPAQIHRGETIIPKTFTDAIKAGEMTLGRQSEQVIRNVIIMDGQVIYDKISKATYDGRLPISSRAVI